MPYTRRTRVPLRRRSYGRFASRRSAISSAIKSAEKKDYVTPVAQQVDTTGSIFNLTEISASGIPDRRIGGSVRALGLYTYMTFAPSAVDENNVCRLLIGVSKTGLLGVADMPATYYGPINPQKYHVLLDHVFSGCLNNANAGVSKEYKQWYHRLNLTCKYNDVNGTSQLAGEVFAFVISDSGAIPNPSLNGYFRLIFCDV